MSKKHVVIGVRYVTAIALLIAALSIGPPLMSLPSNAAVIGGAIGTLGALITAAAVLAGYADRIIKDALRMLYDAFIL